MRTYTLAGALLITIAVVAFAYQGITFTTQEKVLDVGSLHMSAEKTRTIPLPPIVGGVALVSGIVLLALGSRKAS
ncbi:MAG: DUF3185 domain-containing protein [Nitrospinae bacterium]|nr:DUF3185 domain-containing protein [Nitrospinota bacterium]